ncbi:MAG: nickel-responsive transcriptional regulator NikR [Thermodesulfobacteriota bacterium]
MLQRFSVAAEDTLLSRFDAFIQQRRYSNRSEAIRDLIRKAFVHDEWEADREVIGVITMVYDHHQRLLQAKITDLQHDFAALILSTTHIHVDHHHCLEVVIVRGAAGRIRELADGIGALKGVKDTNLAMSSTAGHLG